MIKRLTLTLVLSASLSLCGCAWLRLKSEALFGSSKTLAIKVLNLGDRTPAELPEKSGSPAILIFWNTWCVPCRLEMNRLRTAVQSGQIPGMRIYAVNLGESPSIVEDFVLKNEYPFQFFIDPDESGTKELAIKKTPTIYHFNAKNEVTWIATGLVTDSIRRAELLFKDAN